MTGNVLQRLSFRIVCEECGGSMVLLRLKIRDEPGASFSGECATCGTRYTLDVEGAVA